VCGESLCAAPGDSVGDSMTLPGAAAAVAPPPARAKFGFACGAVAAT
jgi:hypothetical protein